jgi:predicted outer membrane repeat protein
MPVGLCMAMRAGNGEYSLTRAKGKGGGMLVRAMAKCTSGVTMMELMIVILIAGLMAAAFLPAGGRLVKSMRLRASTETVRSQLAAARIRAIANANTHCGVRFDIPGKKSFMFFDKGATPDNRYTSGTDEIYGNTVSLQKGILFVLPGSGAIVDSVVVFRGNASAKNGGAIQVSDGSGNTRTITILAGTGRVRVSIP